MLLRRRLLESEVWALCVVLPDGDVLASSFGAVLPRRPRRALYEMLHGPARAQVLLWVPGGGWQVSGELVSVHSPFR